MSSLRQVPNLPALIEKYGLKVFVETGCGDGDGLRYAAELGLEPRLTCDLSPVALDKCRPLASGVMLASSTQFLDLIATAVDPQHVLFWLDAHFPEHYGQKGDEALRWPIMDELKILAHKKGIAHDVVICDDMHVIADPANPTYHAWLPEYFQVRNQTINDLTGLLPHKATLYNIDTGILVLEPQ